MFCPPYTGVQLKPKDQQQRNQVKPDHHGNNGPDGTVEFVVTAESGKVEGKPVRDQNDQ